MAQMDLRQHVLSAGRAVLDMMEREWQPLSAGELELRLDQVVEGILESDLVGKVETQPSSDVYVQLLQSKPSPGPQAFPTAAALTGPTEEGATASEADSEAVRCISELLQSSKSMARLAGRARLSLSHTVLLSLSLLSERVSYRSVSRRFQLEKGNIHRIFFSFCERISNLKEEQIRWPVGEEAAEALFPFSSLVVKKEQDDGRCFPQVLGVLGHTQIPIRLPVGKHALESVGPAEKRKKKKAHPDCWLNLELVCSCRGQFLHCRVSKGSNVDRGRRLRDRLKQNPELMPPGSCLVARAGYPLTAQILTPYTHSNGPDQELFNQTLEEHCQILDQAVSSLKVRFKRLTYLDIGNYDRAGTVVYTACVLHNVFVQMGQELQGGSETESTVTLEEEEQEEDEEGVQRRDVVADLLLTNGNSGRT
ncbi:protein ALP1-like [Girardinichthys multiradiatus]|uniref:protein ALP1-like n=1 Tax=Girardinichthys multiradiatus TaxID=208333 RepID=UPI001FABDE0F|nr:protein ALP1-like [Girardinichthys multiradiatus]XP_047215964.1 protein ALP1-like [Girardinichthys multiradiatus]